MYCRLCPTCSCSIEHPNKHAYKQAIKRGRPCFECSKKPENQKLKMFEAACKSCGAIRKYTRPDKIVELCRSCSTKEAHAKNPERMTGSKNPMFRTSAKKIWEAKYGADIANKKMNDLSATRSRNASGEKNPMFGKPAPERSGHGCSGRLGGVSFRSLLELAFLIWFKEQNGYLPDSAETKECSVRLPSGRSYFPDFVDPQSRTVFEVKPKKLLRSAENVEKFNAAKNKYGDKFVVITDELLDVRHIRTAIENLPSLVMNRIPKSWASKPSQASKSL